jgi:3-oxoacyl-[acyl-carrier-protein] synthase II
VLAGAGITCDAHDIVQPDPTGTSAARAIRLALRDAGMDAAEVGHVSAHATATPVGDIAESKAIADSLGTHAVVTAVKSMTGHLLGAAGAVEAIAALLAVREGVVPPTANLDDPDDDLTVDVARNAPREVSLTAAINNSFGFGGHNVALALRAA